MQKHTVKETSHKWKRTPERGWYERINPLIWKYCFQSGHTSSFFSRGQLWNWFGINWYCPQTHFQIQLGCPKGCSRSFYTANALSPQPPALFHGRGRNNSSCSAISANYSLPSVLIGKVAEVSRTHTYGQPEFAYIFPLNQCLKAALLLIISLYYNLRYFMRVKKLIPLAQMSMSFWISNTLSVALFLPLPR